MANDFSVDSNCVALYKFESGALTTDSKDGNTLTDVNTVGEDTVNYMEGTCSADLELNNSEYFYRLDSALDAGFPLKNGDTTKVISVCCWFRPESFNTVGDGRVIWSKYDSNNKRSMMLVIFTVSTGVYRLRLYLGYNGGASIEYKEHLTTLSAGTFYHITCTYDNADKSYSIRLKDTNGDPVGSDLTGTATLDVNKLNAEDARWQVGATADYAVWFFDGLIDELVVFKDVISSAEATQIALGTYGAAGGLSIPVAMATNRMRRN